MTPGDEIRQELERVAQSEPRSGREAMAKVTALPTLERMNRPKDERAADEQISANARRTNSTFSWDTAHQVSRRQTRPAEPHPCPPAPRQLDFDLQPVPDYTEFDGRRPKRLVIKVLGE